MINSIMIENELNQIKLQTAKHALDKVYRKLTSWLSYQRDPAHSVMLDVLAIIDDANKSMEKMDNPS